jgi:hypothetical protein
MTIAVDATLVRDAMINCGGGANHKVMQVLHQYELAVGCYNKRGLDEETREELRVLIDELESELYQIGRKK